ncbi:hypothetical protein H632_c2838p0 [Helicosporidium sp. ATCC 50920]|nr:hypothetical protein H632_c2838p0 [Helicosporidium sp. ATCC 50920]|eukprot:KDD72833.1 hypothetical protein H632_c2838p0 [Helicosporidium sp. ATCC 50920]
MLARFASSTPTVYDRMYADMGVNVTVVDLQGHRHSLRALSGQTVADVMREQSDALGHHLSGRVWTGNNYEGHVKIPTELFARFPLTDAQREILEDIALPGTIDAQCVQGLGICCNVALLLVLD